MKTVNVPVTVLRKRFVVPVQVKTIEDYADVFTGAAALKPETKEKVAAALEKECTAEAQRGPAVLQLVHAFLTSLSEEKEGLIGKKIAEIRALQNSYRDMEREAPEIWGNHFDKKHAEWDRQVKWYATLQQLMSMSPPPKDDE